MLSEKVEENPNVKGYIFDGFPRTIPQAEALDNLLKGKGLSISKLIALDVDDEEIVSRLLERGKTSGRADDTDESIIRNRIAVYKKETSPVYDYYGETGHSMKIKGIGSIEDIFGRLCNEIDKLV